MTSAFVEHPKAKRARPAKRKGKTAADIEVIEDDGSEENELHNAIEQRVLERVELSSEWATVKHEASGFGKNRTMLDHTVRRHLATYRDEARWPDSGTIDCEFEAAGCSQGIFVTATPHGRKEYRFYVMWSDLVDLLLGTSNKALAVNRHNLANPKPAAGGALSKLTNAQRALAEAKTLPAIRDVRDQAVAVVEYCKAAKLGTSMVNDAVEIKVEAECKAGGMLAKMEKKINRHSSSNTLLQLGIERIQSHRWQRMASVPEKVRREYYRATRDAGGEMTSAGILKLAVRQIRERQKQKRRDELSTRATSNGKAHKDWTIITGDCLAELEKVEAGSAALIFADPPYNIGIDYGKGAKADRLPPEEYLNWCAKWIYLCTKALADDGSLWVLINDEWADYFGVMLRQHGLHRRAWIKWYETFGVNCSTNFNRCSRHIFYCVTNPKDFVFNADAVNRPSDRQTKYADKRASESGKLWDDVWNIPRLVGTAKERIPDFPTQLPLELLRPIIGCASMPGDLVIDPFNGSGTTGAACIELGRRYLGIERSEDFAHISRRRLSGVKP